MKNKRVLISGASIAGPTLGYWLQKFGFEVTIVEQTPALRTGGHGVDIRGSAVEVVKKMGIYENLSHHRLSAFDVSILDDQGKLIDAIAADNLGVRSGDDLELLRGDLNQILYQASVNQCEYIFNNSIQSVQQHKDGIFVEFTNGKSREFDILVGADGLHSKVRSLVFGDESLFSHNLGDYYFAISSIESTLNLNKHQYIYSKIGKLVNVYCLKGNNTAEVMFVFQSPGLVYDYKNTKQQKEIVSSNFSDAVWKVPELLESMKKSSAFYFDEVKQIRMSRWFKDRTVLIGDAAYSPCVASGQGSGLALAGAYILAGELKLAKGDYQIAFAEYQKEMKDFVEINQRLGKDIIEHMIPKTSVEPWIGAPIYEQIQKAAKSIVFKDYQSAAG